MTLFSSACFCFFFLNALFENSFTKYLFHFYSPFSHKKQMWAQQWQTKDLFSVISNNISIEILSGTSAFICTEKIKNKKLSKCFEIYFCQLYSRNSTRMMFLFWYRIRQAVAHFSLYFLLLQLCTICIDDKLVCHALFCVCAARLPDSNNIICTVFLKYLLEFICQINKTKCIFAHWNVCSVNSLCLFVNNNSLFVFLLQFYSTKVEVKKQRQDKSIEWILLLHKNPLEILNSFVVAVVASFDFCMFSVLVNEPSENSLH